MNARALGCGLNLLISAACGVAAARLAGPLLPTLPAPFVILLGLGTGFVVAVVLAKLQTALFPHANVLRAREQERALRDAPARACAEAVVGSYVRLTGVLEADEPISAGLTGRPCVVYRVTRQGMGGGRNDWGATKQRQHGTRARLLDASGSIEIDLVGLLPTATGDALADAIALGAAAKMGEHARLSPKIEFAPTHRAALGTDGVSGAWPAGTPAPDHSQLDALSDREGFANQGRARWEEEILAPGDRVEVAGLVLDEAGKKVLTAPPNGQMHVRCV